MASPFRRGDLCVVTDDKARERHEFTAEGPNEPWLTDNTEHRTGEASSTPGPALVATREELRITVVTWIERTYHRSRRQAGARPPGGVPERAHADAFEVGAGGDRRQSA